MLAIDELFTTTTWAQVRAKAFELAEGVGLSVSSWGPFSPTRGVFSVLSYLGAAALNSTVVIAKSGFLTTAEDGFKTVVAKLVYDVDRIEKTFAVGEVTLDNNAGGVYDFDPGEFVVKNASSGKTYFNTEVLHVGSLQQNLPVGIQAFEAGSASNAAVGEISQLVTQLSDVTVTNALELVAVDEEGDDALEERSLLSLGALSPNGAKAAIAFVARTPDKVSGVVIDRVRIGTPPGDATLDVWIAGPAGEVSDSDKDKVQEGVDIWATPDIGTITIRKATNHDLPGYDVTLYVTGAHGLLDSEWTALVKGALLGWVNGVPADNSVDPPIEAKPGLPIGGYQIDPLPSDGVVPWRGAIGVIKGINEFVVEAELAAEVDETLDDSEVARLASGDITVVVVEV